MRHSPTLVSFHYMSEVRPLPSTGITRLRRYYAPVRHPRPPSLALAGYRLGAFTHHDWGFPCCTPLLFHTCRRHYPGGIVRCLYRSLLQRQRPSLIYGQVGFRITLFEACSAFTARYGLHGRQVAQGNPLHRRLQQFRYLHYCSDYYRLERQMPGGIRTHGRGAPLHGAPKNRCYETCQIVPTERNV